MNNKNDFIDITGAREIKIPPYRLAYLDKLFETRRPFAARVVDTIYSLDKQSDIVIENLLVDAIITLEELNAKYQSELWEYKQRFGELR